MIEDNDRIFSYPWKAIQLAQQGDMSGLHPDAPSRVEGQDYGADPLGEGMHRMIPSGDIVDTAERRRRLKHCR